MDDIVGIIKSIVREELKTHRTAELGIVTKLYSHESGRDKNNYACSVKLKDSDLELQNVGICTDRIGKVAIPNKNDLVLVQFINGDVNNAVITGRLYNEEDRPPVAKPHEHVYISPDQEESGTRRIYLEFPRGNKIMLNDDEVYFKAGSTLVKLNNDGDLEIEANSKVLIMAKSDVAIGADGNISLDSSGNIDIKALGTLSIDAMDISIKGKMASSIEAGGDVTVRGTAISVGGLITFSP